jgi:hypothetical protein
MIYKRRATETIRAIQYKGTNLCICERFCNNAIYPHDNRNSITISLGEGLSLEVHIGDWIIKKGNNIDSLSNEKFNNMYYPYLKTISKAWYI